MDLLVLDKNFDTVGIIDVYESFNWIDRYNEAGDFELIVLATDKMLSIFKTDYYLYFSMSDHLMIIEEITVTNDEEDGSKITVAGRSLESILDRRCVWDETTFKESKHIHDAIYTLIRENITQASITSRRISGFVCSPASHTSITDPAIKNPTLSEAVQYIGDNLYDLIVDICKLNKIGFKILHDETDSNRKFVFSLYNGTDRTYANQNLPPVVFSPYFENISNTTYYISVKTYKTCMLVTGEEIEDAPANQRNKLYRKGVRRGNSDDVYSGLYRRESYTDARDISKKTEDDVELTDREYEAALSQRGKQKIVEEINSKAETFEGEVDYRTSYEYGKDYFLGDLVEIADVYGHETSVRVSEMMYSFDSEGFSMTPSFTVPDDEEVQ